MKFHRRAAHCTSLIAPFALIAVVSCASLQPNPDSSQTDRKRDDIEQSKTEPVSPSGPGTDKDRYGASNLWSKFLERLVDPVTWFTGALVVLSYRQWTTYKRQAGLMSDALTETRNTIAKMDEVAKAQGKDMGSYIAQATRSAEAMEGIMTTLAESTSAVQSSLAISKEISDTNKRIADTNNAAFRAGSRARLSVPSLEVDLWGCKNPEILVHIRNMGSEPATIRRWAIGFTLQPLPPTPDDVNRMFHGNEGPVTIGAPITIRSVMDSDWIAADWDRIVHGQTPLSIWGTIWYDTGFPDIPGEVGFGFEYNVNSKNGSYGDRFSFTGITGYNYSN